MLQSLVWVQVHVLLFSFVTFIFILHPTLREDMSGLPAFHGRKRFVCTKLKIRICLAVSILCNMHKITAPWLSGPHLPSHTFLHHSYTFLSNCLFSKGDLPHHSVDRVDHKWAANLIFMYLRESNHILHVSEMVSELVASAVLGTCYKGKLLQIY